jgi:FkbM family methyltransferase
MKLRRALNLMLNPLGYDLRRFPQRRIGSDALNDIRLLSRRHKQMTIFDVGANYGQSAEKFSRTFGGADIHCFEPSREACDALYEMARRTPRLHVNNLALGDALGEKEFVENDHSTMSSLLKPSVDCWGKISLQSTVPVSTVDHYCRERSISGIHLLKTDTQGYDYHVLQGCREMLQQNRVHLVLTEVIFSDMYEGLPRVGDLFNWLTDHRFRLVNIYDVRIQNERAGWTDMLFANPHFDFGEAAVQAA